MEHGASEPVYQLLLRKTLSCKFRHLARCFRSCLSPLPVRDSPSCFVILTSCSVGALLPLPAVHPLPPKRLFLPCQHVVVELENPANVRFLHARKDGGSLHAIGGLGGAGAGGPADDAMYLWPKYAAGMTYSASFLDALFGQAFYRPSRCVDMCACICVLRSCFAAGLVFVPPLVRESCVHASSCP